MPATAEIVFRGGGRMRVHLPAEARIRKKTVEIDLDRTKPIASIDPDHVISDETRANNVLNVGG